MFYSPKRKYNYDNIENEKQENDNDSKKKEINNIEYENIKESINETKTEELEFENQKYNLTFTSLKENNLLNFTLIPAHIQSGQQIYNYKGSFTYGELISLCKSFKMYDSIEEIYSALILILSNKKKIFLKLNENNSFNIIILISSVTGKEEEIVLPLEKIEIFEGKKEEKNESSVCKCDELRLQFKELENKLKQENYELKNEIYYLKDDINRYVKTIENNKKEIKNLKTQIKNLKNMFEEKLKILNDKILNYKPDTINENQNINNSLNKPKEEIEIKTEVIKDNLNINSNSTKKLNRVNTSTNNKSLSGKLNINQKKNNKISFNQNNKNINPQEKLKNNKREIYQQMKAENAKKLNNNKLKTSFNDFLRQKKLNEKNKNKKITQSCRNIEPEILVNKEEENEEEENKEKIEEEYDNNKEENDLNINNSNNSHQDINDTNEANEIVNEENENENMRYENQNLSQEEEKEKDYLMNYNSENNYSRMKNKEINRNDMIDQWTNDFNLNVKKLLEDNDSKLRFTEKLNIMNRRIITKIEELQLIENQLLKEFPSTKEVDYILIYRSSEHGDSAEIFHQKCDELKNNLIIIKTKENIKFGGFTQENWEGDKLKKTDEKAFCFYLNINKIYEIDKDKTAILCNKNIGPCFGDKFFEIFDNFEKNGGKFYDKDNCGYLGLDKDYEITNGNEDFSVEEIEVYKINFK